jgi:hypothetical protein
MKFMEMEEDEVVEVVKISFGTVLGKGLVKWVQLGC